MMSDSDKQNAFPPEEPGQFETTPQETPPSILDDAPLGDFPAHGGEAQATGSGAPVEDFMVQTPPEQVTEDEFGNLDDLGSHATEQPAATPTPEGGEFQTFSGAPADPSPLGESGAPEAQAFAPDLTPPSAEDHANPNTLGAIKKFSEAAPTMAAVPAGFPFSLYIEGALAPEEKEKLLDIISRENMGIREMDLDPQFESGKVLIPRISEYAGVLLVQALRGTRARVQLGPSDQIFSNSDSIENPENNFPARDESASVHEIDTDTSHEAEKIPITAAPSKMKRSSDLEGWTLIDTVTASATLKATGLEVETSTEYQELLEALQRELKFKAFIKGAEEIHLFTIQLTPLTSPTRYLVTVSGSAVCKKT